MSSKKNIKIVGGGLTGLALAKYLTGRSLSTVLFERQSSLGGVVRDDVFERQIFLSGCHYLYPETPWVKSSKLNLTKFELQYGSITEDDTVRYRIGASGPILKNLPLALRSDTELDKLKLLKTLPNVRQFYSRWLEFFNIELSNISMLALESLQLQRFFIEDDPGGLVAKLKKNSPVLDDVLGIARTQPIAAAIPKYGFNKLISELISTFENVNISCNDGISATQILGDNADEETQYFWCANPQIMTSSLITETKAVRPTICSRYHFKINGSIGFKVFYLQVYSLKSRVYRIYLYELFGEWQCCVEVVGVLAVNEVLSDTKRLLNFAEISVDLHFVYEVKYKRYVAITERQESDMIKAKNLLEGVYNSYDGGWMQAYRDQKIDYVWRKARGLR